jgi:hypothetical protein
MRHLYPLVISLRLPLSATRDTQGVCWRSRPVRARDVVLGEMSQPVQERLKDAIAHPTRPTPQPISKTSSVFFMPVATATRVATSVPDVLRVDSPATLVAAASALRGVEFSASRTSAYSDLRKS